MTTITTRANEEINRELYFDQFNVDDVKMNTAPPESSRTRFQLQSYLWGLPKEEQQGETSHPSRDLSFKWHSKEPELLSVMSPFIRITSEDEVKTSETQLGIRLNCSPDLAGSRIRETCDRDTPNDIRRYITQPQIVPEQQRTVRKNPTESNYSKEVQEIILMAEDLTRPDEQYRLLRRLQEFEQLTESERWPTTDWPTPQAFADARAFIRAWNKLSMLAPHLTLADDGEINFYWGHDGIHIDLGFYGTGAYSYYAHGKGEERFSDNNVPAATGLPAELMGLLGT